jgi:hypothetical protein
VTSGKEKRRNGASALLSTGFSREERKRRKILVIKNSKIYLYNLKQFFTFALFALYALFAAKTRVFSAPLR